MIRWMTAAVVCSMAFGCAAKPNDPIGADLAPLQPGGFPNHVHPETQKTPVPESSRSLPSPTPLPSPANPEVRSDVLHMISLQTPVKSQVSRGTCSIFSATALLESMLLIRGDFSAPELDLSEEWLEYVATRWRSSDGSTSPSNFRALRDHGTPREQTLPYIGEEWTDASYGVAARRCGSLLDPTELASCLIGHFSPRLLDASDRELERNSESADTLLFLSARREAYEFRDQHLAGLPYYFSPITTERKIKELLRKGIPLTLDQDFFYGAWNHRKASELGLGRDMQAWYQGIVGYPEASSLDYTKSRGGDYLAGHSIVIVGYDDDVEIKTRVLMRDGITHQEFTYKGVYYFKNSWGMAGFGRDFVLNGVNYPGYGMMTQRYAHEQGTFYSLPIRLGRQ